MKNLLSWGYEDPVKGDYIKNVSTKDLNEQKSVKFKIRKMDKEFISEGHDNYRKPEYSPEKGVYLFDYLQNDGQDLLKKKVFD